MAALPDSSLVSLEEYLRTPYEPDMEFVDGVLVERNVGDWLHALVQTNLAVAIRRKYPHLKVVVELRSRTAATRYRIPDSVLLSAPKTDYLLDAGFLAVEVISKRDAISAVMGKLKEYAALGVPNIWLIDPRLQLMSIYRPPALVEMTGDSIATEDGNIELSRAEIFAD